MYVLPNPLLSLGDIADILEKVGDTIWISLLQTGDPSYFDEVTLTDS